MYHIHRLSEAVYVGLCHKVGSPTEVRFRREVVDTEDIVRKPLVIMQGLEKMKSGSTREGFRLRTSDLDWMSWPPDQKVICDLSQINLYRIPQHTLIMMECDDLPPGFTRLNVISPSENTAIQSSCLLMNNKIYISSVLFRCNYLRVIQTNSIYYASVILHGPCSSKTDGPGQETDIAVCLKSHHWPTAALPWIQRCHKSGWPSEIVLLDILRGGFHVVPIGSTSENGQEWRISFSQAEQKLVYSMNHSQFLCYGLFKIFLKEVINFQNTTPLLCSYFIKTIVFWVIQTNDSLTWTPDNLLSCFWECFKLLIYWVRIGECPNFFIPQNNMFRLKVTGSVQTSLFYQLYNFYCKGIPCLLLSQTLRPYLSKAILSRTLRVCTDESSFKSTIELDISLVKEFYEVKSTCCIEELAVYMKQIERMIRGRLTPYQAVTLQCLTSEVLRNTAFWIQNSTYPNKNRNIYYKISKASVLLKLSSTLGYVSDILYLAVFFYRTRRYKDSLTCLQKAQYRMSLPYIMYYGQVNVDMYNHYIVGMSLGNKIRRAVIGNIMLHSEYTYLNELVLEQKISGKIGWPLFIPPLVMLHMLLILNHHRLGDTVKSQQSLWDLQTLLLYDIGFNVPIVNRDLSWQILGICQQICGDHFGSLHSYQHSLQQYPFHGIQEATLLRMNTFPQGAI